MSTETSSCNQESSRESKRHRPSTDGRPSSRTGNLQAPKFKPAIEVSVEAMQTFAAKLHADSQATVTKLLEEVIRKFATYFRKNEKHREMVSTGIPM